MIVPGMFVCSSFLISVCMFIVSKALLISSATVIVREGGAIWLNPFATVLFSVWSIGPFQHQFITVNYAFIFPVPKSIQTMRDIWTISLPVDAHNGYTLHRLYNTMPSDIIYNTCCVRKSKCMDIF